MEELATAKFHDNKIVWEPYTSEDIVCDRFSLDEWHLAVADIHSDDEWNEFLQDNTDFVCCKILREIESRKTIGFIYIMEEDERKKVVSIHGGGWEKSMKASILYYHGFFCVIKSLLDLGYKVRTTCVINNENAYRFIKGTGFVCYYTSQTLHHFWINEKRLTNNPLFRWIYK